MESAKNILKEKFIAIYAYLTQKNSQVNNLTLHLKEQQQQQRPKVNRNKVIIKIRAAEIKTNKQKSQKAIEKIDKIKSWYSEKINKIGKLAIIIKKKRGPK